MVFCVTCKIASWSLWNCICLSSSVFVLWIFSVECVSSLSMCQVCQVSSLSRFGDLFWPATHVSTYNILTNINHKYKSYLAGGEETFLQFYSYVFNQDYLCVHCCKNHRRENVVFVLCCIHRRIIEGASSQSKCHHHLLRSPCIPCK